MNVYVINSRIPGTDMTLTSKITKTSNEIDFKSYIDSDIRVFAQRIAHRRGIVKESPNGDDWGISPKHKFEFQQIINEVTKEIKYEVYQLIETNEENEYGDAPIQ